MRSSTITPGARELFRRSVDGRETVLAAGDLRQAVVLEGDGEAVLDATLPKEAAESYSVIGLDQPDDVRFTLPTQPSTSWVALWRSTP
jgi:hypothetical protein